MKLFSFLLLVTGALAEVVPEYTSSMIYISDSFQVDTNSWDYSDEEYDSPVPIVVLWQFTTADPSTKYRLLVENDDISATLYDSGLQSGTASDVTPLLFTDSPDGEYELEFECTNDPVGGIEPNCVGTLQFVLIGCGCPEYLPITVSECTYASIATATAAVCTDEPGPEPPTNGGGPVCFPESASVLVQDKGKVAMKDLQIGDLVLANGKYQPVYAFGHHESDETAPFLQLHTEEEKPLELSSSHLVFLDGNDSPVPAHSIQVGDVLQGVGAGRKVSKIASIRHKGLYAPFTADGTVVVDGILASSYVSLEDPGFKGALQELSHHAIHAGLAPFRLLCMGVSPALCSSYDDDGVSRVFSFAARAFKWTRSQPLIVETLISFAYFLLFAVCWLSETAFGPASAPLVLVLFGGMYSWYTHHKKNHCKSKTA